MTHSPQPKSWRDVLPVHPAADLFPRMSESELRELGEDIKKNGLKTSVAIYYTKTAGEEQYWLLDGRNRLDAMEAVGLAPRLTFEPRRARGWILTLAGVDEDDLPQPWSPSGDPYAHVVSTNIRRRHLTTEQKRDLIERLLKAKPQCSDRTIAKQTKVDHKTVGKTRTRLEATGEIPQLKKTVGADGKSRSKRTPKPAAPPIIELGRSDYSEVPATSAKPTSPATSVSRLSATVHFLVNDISRLLKEANGKLSAHDRTEVFTRIRALVDTDDIVDEALRLVDKMTLSQRRDFIARLQKGGLVVACGLQGSAEIPIEQPQAEHAALDEIPADLSIPARLRRLQ
jgi:hypothetical protein